jgi:acyl dehydratase
MTEIRNLAALGNRLGEEVAVSDWFDVSQERIAQFAEATEDRQWIHVDAARAAKESPYKTTIAHGFLTLSLASVLIRRTFSFEGVKMAINYGVNRVRFITAVPAGSRVRARFALVALEEIKDGGTQVIWGITLEREGGDKPCAVVEWVVRYYVA